MPSAAKQRRQHLVRLAVHEVDAPALVGAARRRAAVAGAREHEAAQAVRVAELRAGSPSTSRPSRGPRAGTRPAARSARGAPTHCVLDAQRAAAPGQTSTNSRRGGIVAHAARRRARARAGGSAGSCRWPSSAARRRTRSTRGYLYGASRSLTKAFSSAVAHRLPRLEHDEGLGLGQALGVLGADHRALEHRRVLHQRRLDLERRHVDAAHLEHVVAAAGVGVVAVGVAHVLVAALGPAALEGVARSSRGCPSTSAPRSGR